MNILRNQQIPNPRRVKYVGYAFLFLTFFLLSGCSIWNGYLDLDYDSSRADRLCHPYGECLQGTWIAAKGATQDSVVAETQCQEKVDSHYGNGWWGNSVSRGMEIGNCMEAKGFTLKQ